MNRGGGNTLGQFVEMVNKENGLIETFLGKYISLIKLYFGKILGRRK